MFSHISHSCQLSLLALQFYRCNKILDNIVIVMLLGFLWATIREVNFFFIEIPNDLKECSRALQSAPEKVQITSTGSGGDGTRRDRDSTGLADMREEAPSTERAAQQEVKQTDGETDKGVCVSLNYVI